MRTKDSICFLCQSEKATQENSHILPKFIANSVLGASNAKKGVIIDPGTADKAPTYIQDTDKEDYLLCPSCESYFSILERYIANHFHNILRDSKESNRFKESKLETFIIKECLNINPIIFRLFIYSLIWRCSISSGIFSDFHLDSEEEELLRATLVKYKSISQKDFIEKVKNDKSIIIIPFVMITAQTFNDKTGNITGTWGELKNPYHLFLNEYLLIFSFDKNDKQACFNGANNIDNSNIKILFFTKEFWSSYQKEYLLLIAEIAKGVLKEKGLAPWVTKKNAK